MITEFYVFYMRRADASAYMQYPSGSLMDPDTVCKYADSFWLVPGTFAY